MGIDACIKEIQKYRAYITKQQYKTLVGQAKKGDTEPAMKGLNKLLYRIARDYK